MWVYLKTEPGLWTVGHYAPCGQWVSESDHASAEDAADWCHYLNGGSSAQLRSGVAVEVGP